MQYQLDEQDLEWTLLAGKAHGKAAVDAAGAAALITDFEVQCHDGITRAFSDEVAIKGIDRVCDICLLPDSDDTNEMVYCEGCDGLVHQRCYGITRIPEDDWYCQPCRPEKMEQGVVCCLCPNRGGMFKRTVGTPHAAGEWCHVQCGLWVPDARIKDPIKMEPVVLTPISAARQKLHCYLCKIKTGACIQCNVPTCSTAFHVSCAVFNGLRLELVTSATGTVTRNAYCIKHQRHKNEIPQKATRHIVNGPGKLVPEVLSLATTEFCDFVSLDAVDLPAKRGVGKPSLASIAHVYAYWVQRRRAAGGRPLIRELNFTRSEFDRRLHRPDEHTEARSLATLRGSLDAIRTLGRLTREREKKKLALFDLMQSEFTLSAKTFAESLDIDLGELSWAAADTASTSKSGSIDNGGNARKRLRHSK